MKQLAHHVALETLLVDRRGFEPRTPACKASVFPIIPTAHGAPTLNRTEINGLQNRHNSHYTIGAKNL